MKYLIVLISLGLVACGTPNHQSNNVEGKTMQVFGDSHAYRADFHGYAEYIAKDKGLVLINDAEGGTWSTHQLQKVIQKGQKYTEVKMIMPGTNDWAKGISIQEYKGNLKAIIGMMSDRSSVTYIIGAPSPYEDSFDDFEAYREATAQAVKELNLPNVKYIDAGEMVFSQNEMNDNIHYNEEGLKRIASFIEERM